MAASVDVLVVGAGPTGLAAALFLAEMGRTVRLIEMRPEPSPHSKAFGVNARTLELLEATGVTRTFLENGRRLEHLSIHRADETLVAFDLTEVDHAYPFLCVQSQADSERLLAEAVEARAVSVERGTELLSIGETADDVEAVVLSSRGRETVRARAVFAADGAASTVRSQLDIDFSGVSYPEPWTLYDVQFSGPLELNGGHIFLLDDGGMFVVRQAGDLWRVLGNGRNLLRALPSGTEIGPTVWESTFSIANRVAATFSHGRIYLGGDAAHVHAGIGARGMNLGIEDAYVFAALLHSDTLEQYNARRRPVVQKVVRQISHMMSVPRSSTVPGRIVRRFPGVVRHVAPQLRKRVQPWLLGLDHSVTL